ncbi:MAG: METTL5 family protein [Candidatus Aenigmarchaeota archaeon]|nr:METTL5 family protein [Candidatus Aenigmarchaeota archaeon]
MNKKQLEITLSKLKDNPNPRVELEQYTIPSDLAAEILNLAYLNGDVKGKVVVDLGCGSGRLMIGAALMDAKKVIGIDVNKDVLAIAKENVKIAERLTNQEIGTRIKLVCKDVSDWDGNVDTIIQNPPFGIQKLHADRHFLQKALECARKIYSLHRHYEKSRIFLKKLIEQNGGKVEKIIKFKFKIPYMFKFHKKPYAIYDVDLFIISRLR